MDVRVPVPETTKSHRVLIIGSLDTDLEGLSPTIFYAAHAKDRGGTPLRIMQQGRRPRAFPLVFLGPAVEELNLAGRWSKMGNAPMVLNILNISSKLTSEGKSMPIRECYTLHVSGTLVGQELWQGRMRLANADIGDNRFQKLPRRAYTLKAGGENGEIW